MPKTIHMQLKIGASKPVPIRDVEVSPVRIELKNFSVTVHDSSAPRFDCDRKLTSEINRYQRDKEYKYSVLGERTYSDDDSTKVATTCTSSREVLFLKDLPAGYKSGDFNKGYTPRQLKYKLVTEGLATVVSGE